MRKIVFILMVGGCVTLLSGCFLKPYVADVQQGNVLTQSQLNKLKIGMTKKQVRSLLGSTLLKNAFNDNCWTYVSTNQVNGGAIKTDRLVLYFRNNRLVKIGG